ncbi:hypothetical protein C7974DRAFT_476171 [Boeremia exigua]|uniref:uncharacterized protein n=1 Tax=Boeremia exigua TaxID=749465 RepID=UPI001E8ED6EF|nr:uncharacterized protein C7974DRAFT_476171 [Boeremia exigua]KAH6613073.1 hypothetical protein C7974DRAFT_476171 [Boeremia exigua]
MHRNSRAECYQFRDQGSCPYGVSCKFSHNGGSQSGSNRSRGNAEKRKRYKIEENSDAITMFFLRYPEFSYDCKRGLAEEFYRMCDFFAWDRDDREREEARQGFKDAMVIRFNGLYGTDINNLEHWHRLCVAVHIEPMPVTIAQCKEIKTIHVNLVDLVDTSDHDPELFSSLEELREYTIESRKFFPKESAYAGGILKFLLREIL